MVSKQLHTLFYGTTFSCIEHVNNNLLHVSIIKKDNNELSLLNTYTINNIEALIKKELSQKRTLLTLNIDQVLTKRIETSELDSNKLLYKAFPNIDLSDFFYQIAKEKNTILVSICRKTVVNSILKHYKMLNIPIFDIYLGFSPIVSILEYYDKNVIVGSNFNAEIVNQSIKAFSKTEENTSNKKYSINDVQIPINYIVGFSSTVSHLNRTPIFNDNLSTIIDGFVSQYKVNRFQKLLISYGLSLALFVLIINFLFFMNYFNEVEHLKTLTQVNLTSKNKLNTLKKEVDLKNKLITNIYSIEQSKLSLISNSIIRLMPNTISLKDLIINPILKPIKSNKNIELDNNSILVSGTTNSKEDFNTWMILLEHIKWIEHIDITEFTDSNKKSNFKFKITYFNEKIE